MTKLEQAAKEWVGEFAKQLPGLFDRSEGVKCFNGGVTWLREQITRRLKNELDYLDKMDGSPFFSDNKIAHEINSIRREVLNKVLGNITSICEEGIK